MQRKLSFLAGLFLLYACLSQSAAEVYYVATTGSDSNSCDGGPSTVGSAQNQLYPRRTIVAGIACIRNSGGDSLFIRAGTYDQRVDTTIKSGTSDTNRTLIAAFNQEQVILKATGNNCVLALSSPSATRTFLYITFDGLIIDGTGGTGYGICQAETFGGGFIGHNIYRNGEVKNTHFSGISGLNQFDEVHHMLVHDNGLTNATPQSHGMYVCAMDTLIHDNEFYHNGAYGIQFYYSGAGAVGCSSRSKIYNNRIYDNAAITLTGGHSAGGMVICCGDSVEIFNNLFYNNARSAGSFGGGGLTPIGYSGPNTNMKVYNNTFYNNKGDGISITSGTPHLDIKNNIFWANGLQPLNDLSGNTTPLESSNLTVNPQFTNAAAGDFTPLTGSPAIDTGSSAVPVQSADYLGKPRVSGSKIDIGAIEVQQGGGLSPGDPVTIYVAQTGGSDTLNDCNAAKSQGSPKLTIAGGLGCMTAPGSTLLIKQGIYPEKIDTSTAVIPGGVDYAHATTIAAFGNDVVTLQIPGSGVGLFFRDATNSHYIIVDRINIDGLSQHNTNGFVCYPGVHHMRYQNGEIRNTYYEPVYISDGANCEVLNSRLHDWSNLSGVHARGAASGTIVRGNTIYNGPGSGVKIDANETGTAMSGVLIEQNIIHHVGTTSSLAALLLGGTGNTGLIVRNNLVYASYRGIEIVTGSPTVKVYNNTVHGSTNTGIQVNTGAVSTNVRNNISYGNGSTPIVNNGTTSVCCGGNQILDPTFVDVTGGADGFKLQPTSTAIDTGVNLSPDVVFDLGGVNRTDYRGYDQGAWEFTGTPSGQQW